MKKRRPRMNGFLKLFSGVISPSLKLTIKCCARTVLLRDLISAKSFAALFGFSLQPKA